jgi:NAD(P)-dependent dehydrogenase (short-subunit alcohol dehydrogenase family)
MPAESDHAMEPTLPMAGKICLITGATSGIGAVAARALAGQGATTVIVGRDPDKCRATVAQIQAETGRRAVEALRADLSSQEQIRQVARHFRERYRRLDVLVNNAGGMWMKRRVTVDGLEMTFAVNHLAYFLLTQLLLDVLKVSSPARVVNVSSEAHRKAVLDFEDVMGQRRYNGWQAYCRSKLANLLFTYELARRLAGTGVTVSALHPGWVATGFAGNNGWKGRVWQLVARWFALSPEDGARTVIYLATSPEVEGVSGRYFVRQEVVPSSASSYDETAARQLWKLSTDLTGHAATA